VASRDRDRISVRRLAELSRVSAGWAVELQKAGLVGSIEGSFTRHDALVARVLSVLPARLTKPHKLSPADSTLRRNDLAARVRIESEHGVESDRFLLIEPGTWKIATSADLADIAHVDRDEVAIVIPLGRWYAQITEALEGAKEVRLAS
jgi:hypothetical protein